MTVTSVLEKADGFLLDAHFYNKKGQKKDRRIRFSYRRVGKYYIIFRAYFLAGIGVRKDLEILACSKEEAGMRCKAHVDAFIEQRNHRSK